MNPLIIGNFNTFDWFLVAVLVFSTVSGLMRGLLRTIMGLAGIVVGFILAKAYYADAGDWLSRWIHPAITARIIMFLVIQGAVMALFLIGGKVMRRAVKAVGLGALDRLLGALLGFGRGVFLALAAMMILMVFAPDSDWIVASQTSPYFLGAAHTVSFVVPHDLEQQILSSTKKMKQKAPKLLQ